MKASDLTAELKAFGDYWDGDDAMWFMQKHKETLIHALERAEKDKELADNLHCLNVSLSAALVDIRRMIWMADYDGAMNKADSELIMLNNLTKDRAAPEEK